MSDKLTNEYLMNVIKENVAPAVHDVNGKGSFAVNGATPMKVEPVAQPGTAMANQASLAPVVWLPKPWLPLPKKKRKKKRKWPKQ